MSAGFIQSVHNVLHPEKVVRDGAFSNAVPQKHPLAHPRDERHLIVVVISRLVYHPKIFHGTSLPTS